MRRSYKTQLTVLAGGILLLAGCWSGEIVPPETVATTGTVTWQGQPLARAFVTFIGEDGQSAVGQTDEAGKFTLTSHFGPRAEAKGVVPRDYKVTVSKMVPPGSMSEADYKQKLEAANAIVSAGGVLTPDKEVPPLVELLPAKYSDARQTELRADANDETNDFKFELK